ncbi:MAG: chloride channel protein [Bacteroidetes bacterium]|nr:chloride channel protein [Bacteroidota bacterium]MBS1930730.1 chloride channel protein [Bacteroidota bacterium]
MTNKLSQKKIPISIALDPTLESEEIKQASFFNKGRLLLISALAVFIAAAASVIAKGLIYLINFITHISFYGNFTISAVSPADNHLGIWVIVIPAIGGLIVGLMAFYGSKAIRGHGIPEAMEQILTNQSKIKPTITYLKPISSAISIGTGGPFGAEGPIIATGGALGSTIGQLLKITPHERKILLTAGAAAGMAAIFGSPIAAIFLAIELLLFEFSPRSIIPVSLACITGAAGHYLFFGQEPVFATGHLIDTPSNIALAGYSIIGIIIGLLSVLVTKIVYFIEDSFEKIPIHWMWWPAIGGLAVGIIGYFAPRTLGVGYNNITDVLTGSLPMQIVLSLCLFKFLSWAIALGSGTSGGTLAPLLTIGGAVGALFGQLAIDLFPSVGITIPLAALVGMSAMFAGASRAFVTSIIFALESTGQTKALVPLLATCSASYIISFFLMENTIMTEKISRKGVKAPTSYEPDILEKINVEQVMDKNSLVFSTDNTTEEVIHWLEKEPEYKENYFIISTAEGEYKGILSASNLFSKHHSKHTPIGTLVRRKNISINEDDSLRSAVELMAKENVDVLPVLSSHDNSISGTLSYKNILSSYKHSMNEHQKNNAVISLKRRSLKILIRGQQIIRNIKSKIED